MAKKLACSKRSDSGEQCEVKKAMKSRGGLGREPLLLPRFYFFVLLFTSHRSPLSEHLEQATKKREKEIPFSPFPLSYPPPPPPLPPPHRLTASQILTCSAIQRVGVKRSHHAPCGGILKQTSIHGLFRNVSNAFYVLKRVDIKSS